MRALLLALLLIGCGRSSWTAEVAAGHRQADELIDRGDRLGARRVLASIVDGAGGVTEARRPLLQDTYFRLARLALATQDPATAAREADTGLALGDRSDLFAANLLIVRGAAREALGHNADAATDYERALRINESLLREAAP